MNPNLQKPKNVLQRHPKKITAIAMMLLAGASAAAAMATMSGSSNSQAAESNTDCHPPAVDDETLRSVILISGYF